MRQAFKHLFMRRLFKCFSRRPLALLVLRVGVRISLVALATIESYLGLGLASPFRLKGQTRVVLADSQVRTCGLGEIQL